MDSNVYTQHILVRQAGLPKDFESMELLTEYVVAPNHAVQVFTKKETEGFSVWIIHDISDVVVQVAQFMSEVTYTEHRVRKWQNETKPTVKRIFDVVITGSFEQGSDILGSWSLLGDAYLNSHQLLSISLWENKQRDLVVDNEYTDYTPRGQDSPIGDINWQLNEDIDDLDDMWFEALEEEDDDE